jgi:hypothetical protein
MKTALRLSIASMLVAASAGVPWALQYHSRLELRARQRALEQQAARLSLLVAENGRLAGLLTQATASRTLSEEQLRELLRLRNERRWLAEQTNLLVKLAEENHPLSARFGAGTSGQDLLSPDELEPALAAEMVAAMKRILPGLQSALQKYALANSNQVPDSFSELQDYFPLVGGRKMPGLQTFEFVRDEGPRPGDALVLRGSAGRPSGNGSEVRVCGFSDGRVVEVSSEDGQFDAWEAQHLGSAPAGTEGKISVEARETAQERVRVVAVGVSLGISAEDTGRFFDRLRQEKPALGQKLQELEKELTGSPEKKYRQRRAALEAELNKLAIETLGDKGPALVQKMGVGD